MSSIRFWGIPILIAAIAVAIFGGFRGRAMLVALALTLVISDGVVGDGLKHLIRRPRPNEVVAGVRIVSLNLHHPVPRLMALFSGTPSTGGAHKEKPSGWVVVTFSRPDPDHSRGRSFPSDHTLNAFCAAMVLAFFWRRFGWLFLIPSALVAYSRIYVGSHWPSDVAISIVMAFGLSLLLLALYEYLWRKLGPRLMPRVHKRNPTLWESA